MNLIFPKEQHEDLWHDITAEFRSAGEKIIPYALTLGLDNYDEFLKKTVDFRDNVNVADNLVPATTYFFMNDESRILGAVNIRHQLNSHLLNFGGHIGYGVRPSERRKGYAARILAAALDKCRAMHMKKVLLTCNKNNEGSVKVILKNGGVLENEIINNEQTITLRYWITLYSKAISKQSNVIV